MNAECTCRKIMFFFLGHFDSEVTGTIAYHRVFLQNSAQGHDEMYIGRQSGLVVASPMQHRLRGVRRHLKLNPH